MISNVERVLKKSHEDAKNEAKKEVAKMMLKDGNDIDEIMKCTGLSKEELEN